MLLSWLLIYLHQYTGINSFKMFMAYKDVFMLRDDEVIMVSVTIAIYDHMISLDVSCFQTVQTARSISSSSC